MSDASRRTWPGTIPWRRGLQPDAAGANDANGDAVLDATPTDDDEAASGARQIKQASNTFTTKNNTNATTHQINNIQNAQKLQQQEQREPVINIRPPKSLTEMSHDTRVPHTRSPSHFGTPPGVGHMPALMAPEVAGTPAEPPHQGQARVAGAVEDHPVQGQALVGSAVDALPGVDVAVAPAGVGSAADAPPGVDVDVAPAGVGSAADALTGADVDVAPAGPCQRLMRVVDMIDRRDEEKKKEAAAAKLALAATKRAALAASGNAPAQIATTPSKALADRAAAETPELNKKRRICTKTAPKPSVSAVVATVEPADKPVDHGAPGGVKVKFDKPTVSSDSRKSQVVCRTGFRGPGESKCMKYGEGMAYSTRELAREAAVEWLKSRNNA